MRINSLCMIPKLFAAIARVNASAMISSDVGPKYEDLMFVTIS
jgi:hypothetical protein